MHFRCGQPARASRSYAHHVITVHLQEGVLEWMEFNETKWTLCAFPKSYLITINVDNAGFLQQCDIIFWTIEITYRSPYNFR